MFNFALPLANFGPALCLMALTVAGSDKWLVLSLLITGKATLGAFTGGNAPAVVDVAPMYSGEVLRTLLFCICMLFFVAPRSLLL